MAVLGVFDFAQKFIDAILIDKVVEVFVKVLIEFEDLRSIHSKSSIGSISA